MEKCDHGIPLEAEECVQCYIETTAKLEEVMKETSMAGQVRPQCNCTEEAKAYGP